MAAQGVAVVGSFVVGLTLRADRFPVAGETALARDFDLGPGGKGSNQAVQIARLGTAVDFIGVIGDDDFGKIGSALFAEEGVGTEHLEITTERNTGVGFIILDASGDNRILLDPGSNDLFTPERVRAASPAIAEANVVMAQLEIPAETAREGLAIGKQTGCMTILNPAPARELPPDTYGYVDILTPNQSEARALLGLAPDDPTDDMDLCARLLALDVGTVVLTRGERGAVIVTAEGMIEVPAFRVEVTDSTGAGDAFNGALASALAEGRPLEEGVRRGAAAGALACTKLGVIPALPNADELERLLVAP
jgi:ribokinase